MVSPEDQKCIDHAMWSKNLRVAYWGLTIIGILIFIFTDREFAGLLITSVGFMIFNISIVLDIKHAEWHVKQIKKGEDEK